ncbi:hypothetical cytosolic protein [Coxiella burnetii CbuG_Q212]|nr:hypothetical cytosolic protein [Coxiella burnetii CbuG_Q212]
MVRMGREKGPLQQKEAWLSFSEAKTVFYDENAKMIHDPEHSEEEDRFIILGVSAVARVLVICHCYREKDNVIRIISARKATKREANQYKRVML